MREMYAMGDAPRTSSGFDRPRRSYAGTVVGGCFQRVVATNLDDLSEEDQTAIWADMVEDWDRRAQEAAENVQYHRRRKKEEEIAKAERYAAEQHEFAAKKEEERVVRVQEMKKWLQRKETEIRQKKKEDMEIVKAMMAEERRKAEAVKKAEEERIAWQARRVEAKRRMHEQAVQEVHEPEHPDNLESGREVTIRYLPVFVNGAQVLKADKNYRFLADNSIAQSNAPGLGYRQSKDLLDKDGTYLAWGDFVVGWYEGDGWIRCEIKDSSSDASDEEYDYGESMENVAPYANGQDGGYLPNQPSIRPPPDPMELCKAARRRGLHKYAQGIENAIGSYAASGRPRSAAAGRPRLASAGSAPSRPRTAAMCTQARPQSGVMTRSRSLSADARRAMGTGRPDTAGMPRSASTGKLRPSSSAGYARLPSAYMSRPAQDTFPRQPSEFNYFTSQNEERPLGLPRRR